MIPRVTDATYPPAVGRLRPEQIAQMSTWDRVPDAQSELAALHIIHVTPAGGTTVTHLNPLDPATDLVAGDGDDPYIGWVARPGALGAVTRRGHRQ